MPHRPASHSVLTISAVSYVAERIWPGTQSALAVTIGLGSHLLRDLAHDTGKAFLISTHDLELAARAERALYLKGGSLVREEVLKVTHS